jgi:DNA-binding MarR family transcriptional regulator
MKPSPILVPILINKLKKRIDRQSDPLLTQYNLSKIHLLYLMALYEHPDGFTLKELSEFLGFDKANTTRAISQLIEKGYVEKNAQGSLALKYKVTCTKTGCKVAHEIWEVNERQNKELQKLFTPQEMLVLGQVANKIWSYLDEEDSKV